MKVLDRSLFDKQIEVPSLQLDGGAVNLNKVMPLVKTKLLKMDKLKPVQDTDRGKTILLHPMAVQAFTDLPVDDLKELSVTEEAFTPHSLSLSYDNWRADELLKYILPADQEQLTSYSRVGHIIHLNLREHLLPYKSIIAQVLRDKLVGIRTVVNKAQSIDNTYRNFQLELLVGDPDYNVTVKENGVTYEFDFSTVYWNPRLSMEHERIVNQLKRDDVLYDVFAGVGPFAVPAGKKRCQVLANDLNPESAKWLQHNVKKNKVTDFVRVSNKDGRQFILENVKEDLVERLGDGASIHVVMNLPALATTFLDAFVGLLRDRREVEVKSLPTVHVYCFTPCAENKAEALRLVEAGLKMKLLAEEVVEVNFVRSVAPNKDMMRVDFHLTPRILHANESLTNQPAEDDLSPANKSKAPT